MSRPVRALSALLVVMAACGGVERIDVHDDRLPLDSRRWVGDAEDAVAIAHAWVRDARAERRSVEDWRDGLPLTARGADGRAKLLGSLQNMADARADFADVRVERAEAELDRAEAELTVVNAETAVRHDIDVYDLVELRAERDAAIRAVEAVTVEVDEARAALDQASDAFWRDYRSYIAGGGDKSLLWLPRDRPEALFSNGGG